MRDNKTKGEQSYWYSTALALRVQEEYELDPEGLTPEIEAADQILTGLTAWLNGRISHVEMCDQMLEDLNGLGLNWCELYISVCEFGARKYQRGNFRKGAPVCSYADSAIRHIRRIRKCKELVDPESGLSHLAHTLWNLVQIFEIMQQPEVAAVRDDRLLHHGNLSGGQVALLPPAR